MVSEYGEIAAFVFYPRVILSMICPCYRGKVADMPSTYRLGARIERIAILARAFM